MTGSLSKAAIRTRKLVEGGMPVLRACERTGYHSQNVYSAEWYKALGREPRSGRTPQPATLKARKLIERGLSVKDACRKAGVQPVTIYGSKWWKERLA